MMYQNYFDLSKLSSNKIDIFKLNQIQNKMRIRPKEKTRGSKYLVEII